ncbi:MAG: cyclopropane-fatty-acyl-phospholipid synthase family protein, partial [Planctomycetota bacterium]
MALLPRRRPILAARQSGGLIARAVRTRLERLEHGVLHVLADGERYTFGKPVGEGPTLEAEIEIVDPAFWSSVATRGSVGAGESYIRGHWRTDDLAALMRLFARNHDALEEVESGLARISRPLFAARHALRRNTQSGSRKNIQAHYDLSNDFFELILDPTLTYSAGVFERDDSTLHEAQLAKLDRLCRLLQLQASDHLLEIGTGWGALAMYAAENFGCKVTTTTISEQQYAYATKRIREAGLEDRIEVLLSDYRLLEGQFDKIVSVEMIEAVGHRYYGTYFEKCASLLKPNGLFAMQAITIADRHYERARRAVDFIQRYIFPGSCIPSISALTSAASRKSDLTLVSLGDITEGYVRTLRAWDDNLHANEKSIKALGFDDEFIRLWEFYLAYCEGGFA